jgi:hypothetical protein
MPDKTLNNSEENIKKILNIVKARAGISTTIRDDYLKEIINGIIDELMNINGVDLDVEKASHLMFVVDYTDFRYSSLDFNIEMPRHLMLRLNNLIISDLKSGDSDAST